MNPNLSDFPHLLCEPYTDMMDQPEEVVFAKYIDDVEKWLEAFKKQLEQQLVDIGDVTIHSMHDNVKGKIALQSKKELLKEILGEEELKQE